MGSFFFFFGKGAAGFFCIIGVLKMLETHSIKSFGWLGNV